MTRLFRLAALIVALLLAQIAFAMHGVEHLVDVDHRDGEVCLQCLALANAPAGPTSTATAMASCELRYMPTCIGVSPRLTLEHRNFFRSRAPPVLQR